MREQPERLSRRLVLRVAFGGATAVAMSSILAACSGGGTAPATSAPAAPAAAAPTATTAAAAAAPAAAQATNTPAPAAAAAPAAAGAASIKLSVWPDVADLQIANQTIDGFQKKNPNIKVSPEQWVG